MQTKHIVTLFQNYLTAFKGNKLDSVVECYHLPCTLHTPDKVVLLTDIQNCQKEFADIFLQLKQAKTSDIIARQASYSLVSKELFLVSIDWEFLDQQGEIFADFCAVYHVANIENKLKIINVVSHDLSNSIMLTEQFSLSD